MKTKSVGADSISAPTPCAITPLVIGVDADGTIFTHDYPDVGEDIGAIPVLKKIVSAGHKIVVFTMRDGEELQDVVDWYEKHGIPLYGVNVNPTQKSWTTSPKALCDIYIDDAGLGAPLKESTLSDRPYICWKTAKKMLRKMGVI